MLRRKPTTATAPVRAGIPHTGSLAVDEGRLARLWAMSPAQRIAAAQRGEFTLGEMLRWAARFPTEPPVVEGDWWFITAYLADVADAGESEQPR